MNITLFLCDFLLCFSIRFHYSKACSWSIGFLQILSISKFHHMLESNHSTFYVQSFIEPFLYKCLVLNMQILLFT
jgi:hypothetical protein